MTTSIIVAMAQNRVIGKDGQIPWHLPEDLKRFKKITLGHPVIMGRKTYESMGKPLPGRTNIVVTRNEDWNAEGVLTAKSIQEALGKAQESPGSNEVFLIGGHKVFEEALTFADQIYLTVVEGEFDGDVSFPSADLDAIFKMDQAFKGRSEKSPNLSFSYSFGKRRA